MEKQEKLLIARFMHVLKKMESYNRTDGWIAFDEANYMYFMDSEPSADMASMPVTKDSLITIINHLKNK